MKEDIRTTVQCAHCGAQIHSDEAVEYTNILIYGSHFHCKKCDPDGNWDCMSHDLDDDLH
jgi:hypothetical protein